MSAIGEIVGTGRSADVYAYGEGKVLRRYRRPFDTEREAAAMEHARSKGFPAPGAHALSETEIVMDRVRGPTMLADLTRHPWLIARHATTLARLHEELHVIDAPDWLSAPLGEGDALLHLDLHPENVIMSRQGPVVIDWSNVARGPALGDVALTWLILACSLPPAGLARRAAALAGRRSFQALFLKRFDRARVAAELGRAGGYRLANPRLPAAELEAVARLLKRLGVVAG